MEKIFFRFYFIIPLILISVTVGLLINWRKKKNRYAECTGKIIDFYETTSSFGHDLGKSKRFSPVVRYIVNGRDFEFISGYGATSMKIGDDLPVLYDPNDWAKAHIKTGLYVAPLITGILSVFSLIPQIIFIILKCKGIITY